MSLLNSIGTIYTISSCLPGPSPLYIADFVGGVVGGLTTFILNRFHTFEKLPYDTQKSAEKATETIKQYCNTLRKIKAGDHEFSKDGKPGAEQIKQIFSLPYIAGPEKAAFLAASRVQSFLTRKPMGIRETEGFKQIEATLKSGDIFKALEAKKDELKKARKGGINIDAKINAFFDEVQELLIKKMPASTEEPPTWSDTIGFSLQWGTQLAITWYGRWIAYQYVADYIPASPYNAFYYASMLGVGFFYCKALEWTSRAQMQAAVGTTSGDKKDCRTHLTPEIIEEIKDKVYSTLLFDSELKTAHSDKLDELKKSLDKISKAHETRCKGKVDENLGYITPPLDRKNEEVTPPVVPPVVPPPVLPPVVPPPVVPPPVQQPVAQQQVPQPMFPPQGQPYFTPWPQYGWNPYGPPQGMPQGGFFPPQPNPQAAHPPVKNPRHVNLVRNKPKMADAPPPVAPPKQAPISGPSIPKMAEVKEIVAFPEYQMFVNDATAVLKQYETTMTSMKLEPSAFIAELNRHRRIVGEDYLPRAQKENVQLLGSFGNLLQWIDELKDIVQGANKPDAPVGSPGLNKSNTSRRLDFPGTPVGGLNSTVMSPVNPTVGRPNESTLDSDNKGKQEK